MTDPNQPQQPGYLPPPGARTHEGYLACPKCGSVQCRRLGFTWWGGVIGAKLLTHVKCDSCGNTYNGKTGASNNGAIAIYMVVVGVITLAVMIVLFGALK
ncbi:MAG TPA: hypothetical protein VML75_24350 [Kofleriaceae bacterium]|nr:hypothetical protein [Kofleriaceae bacterium]